MATDTAQVSYGSGQRLWQLPLFLLGVIALAAVTIGRPYLDGLNRNQPSRLLDDARAALKAAPPAFDRVIDTARQLLDQSDLSLKSRGEAQFLLGSALLAKADTASDSDADALRKQARTALEQADQAGVPDGDRPELNIRLCRVWLAAGDDVRKVIPVLTKAAETASDPFAAYGMLVEAHAKLQPPDTVGLLAALRQQVAHAPASADPIKLARARLRLGEMLVQNRNAKDAGLVLTRIGPEAPADVAYAARCLLARCHQEAEDWSAAATAWTQLRDDRRLPAAERPRVLFALGYALALSQRPEEALAAWTEAAAGTGPEAQAAKLRLAEVKLLSDTKGALAAIAEALQSVSKAEDYQNPLVLAADLPSYFERAGSLLRSKGDFQAAIDLAKLYAKVASPGRALAQQGEAAAAWAADLRKRNESEASKLAALDAARSFEAAAGQIAPGPDMANWLMHAGDAALKAGDLALAIEVLKKYAALQPHITPEQVESAWYRLGVLHEQLKNYADAKSAFQRVIQAGGPLRFQARCELARRELVDAKRDNAAAAKPGLEEADRWQIELRARVKFDDAEKLLQTNLEELRKSSTPDAVAQEQTVYGLAEVAYERKDFAAAEPRLRGALQEYPASPRSVRGKYMLANCTWFRASEEKAALEKKDAGDPERPTKERQYVEALTQALSQFTDIDRIMSARTREQLDEDEAEMQVKAPFAVAELQLLMGKSQESLASYEALALRLAGRAEGLHAIQHVWHVWFYYLKDDVKALDALSRLRDAVEKVPEAEFDGSSRIRRKEYWFDKIVELSKLMAK